MKIGLAVAVIILMLLMLVYQAVSALLWFRDPRRHPVSARVAKSYAVGPWRHADVEFTLDGRVVQVQGVPFDGVEGSTVRLWVDPANAHRCHLKSPNMSAALLAGDALWWGADILWCLTMF